MSNTVVIIALSLMVVFSPFLSHITRIPVVVIEIMLGSVIGYFGVFGENEFFDIIAHIGFLYLMFLAGMEVNLKEFGFEKKTLMRRTVIFFAMTYVLSFLVFAYFDLSAVYLVALPIFSLGMLMALIKEYGKQEPWLALALNIGIAGEVISILAMTILNGGLTYGFNVDFFLTLLVLVGFLIGFVLFFKAIKILFWWYPSLKTMIMPHEDGKDKDVRFSMALLFILVGIMLHFKIDAVLGAFLAGMLIVTYFKHKTDLPEKLSSFGFGFLVPIFFIHVGSTLSLDAFLDPEILQLATAIACTMIVIRLIAGTSAFAGYFGFKNALLFSLSNSMPLTFLVAIATLGYEAQAISHEEYYAFIVASMGSAIILMIIIKIINTYFHEYESRD